ncbi:hypothetical protein MLD38_025197 [Melastoma candidum]|uniref:Uncharacterized protein n=1 Tax=Melastoma candidum TaxID=119954 RepID=A0ACB9NVK3_9MYRT|nr:hypothetical protein MLD38_025197 [Melastoma candidum]
MFPPVYWSFNLFPLFRPSLSFLLDWMKRPVPPQSKRRIEFPCWDSKLMKNVKDALSSVKEIVRNSCRFVQLHPNCSGTTAFFLALYLVCPFGFKFLTYSITIFYGVAFIIKAIANTEPRDAGEANKHASKNREFPPLKSDSADGGSIGRTYQKPKISSQMSKRRNFKIRIEDLETLDDSEIKLLSSPMLGMGKVQDLLGDREMKLELSSWHLGADDSIDRNEKLCRKDGEMMLDSSIIAQQGESSSPEKLAAGKAAENLNGNELIPDFAPETGEPNQSREGSRSHSEADVGSEEDDRRQAVEWTDDDQQNLADLGLSEIERNKRLENLIAKRMAKKSMSMKHFEKFVDLRMGPISPVNTSKKPLVPHHPAGDFPDSHLPGSAPSVFSPERNPFDLPYDSNEEKPNLTVDSFGDEILEPHPRDILSRHGSFFYGSSFMPGFDKDSGHENAPWFSVMEKWNAREPRHSRFRQKSDNDQNDWLVEHRLSKGKDPNRLQNEGTTNSIHDNLEDLPDEQVIKQRQEDASAEEDTITESVSSTSEDQKEATETSNDLDFSFQGISPRLANILSYENVSQATEHTDGRSGHTSTFSIASDMQVEISGGSTPRNLADYTPDDAESSTHDDDKDRRAGFTDEEIWGALSKRNDSITLDLPDGGEDEEPSKENNCHNSNNMSYPFGSYISLIELDREEFHLLKQLKGAPSPESSCDNDVEVRKSRFDDPSNENTSESTASEDENYSVQSASDHTPSERDEEVNEENQ